MLWGALFLCFITFTYYLVGYEAGKGFVFFRTEIGFLLAKREFVRDNVWMTAFYCHVTSCTLCLFVAPFQFVGYIRKHYTAWHHLAGKIYIASILFLGAPSGFYMALFANGGFGSQLGFSVLSILWIVSTYSAYCAIRNRDWVAHRAWMVRSYAFTFSAVTLRVLMPLLTMGY